MTDPFVEIVNEPMSRTKESAGAGDVAVTSGPTPEKIRESLSGRRVCPYCGMQSPGGSEACPRCSMEDSPATRQATKSRIGPWYVLQSRNPAAPGMRYATLLALIGKGHVTARSIVRGPTTHQLWRFAAHVRGVSREFGICYSCGGAIDRTSAACPHCERPQEAPADPDVLLEIQKPIKNQPAALAPAEPATPVEVQYSHAARMRELNRQKILGERESRDNSTPVRPRHELARRPDERVVSAMELAAALQEHPHDVPESRPWLGRLVRRMGLAVFVLGSAGAVVLYFNPEMRKQTSVWLNDGWATIQTKVSSVNWPKVSRSTPDGTAGDHRAPENAARQAPAHAPAVASPRTTVDLPSTEVAAVPDPLPDIPTSMLATPDSDSVSTAALLPAPATPQPAVAQAPAPVQQPRLQPQPQAPAPPAAVPADSPALLEQSRQLWRQAIDAEQVGKYGEAVRIYEQIKTLPRDVWPSALQVYLDAARKQAGQGPIPSAGQASTR